MITKLKPRSLLVTLGATAALIAGGGATYWLVTQRDAASSLPVGAALIPQEALVSLTVSTDTDQWQRLRQFGTPETQAALDRQLQQLQEQYLTRQGYRYQTDIQPWVGERMTVAFLPQTQGANQALVWVLPIADLEEAQQVMQAARGERQLSQRNYKGVTLWEAQGQAPAYAAAVLDQRFVVLASQPQLLEQVIDTLQGEDSLADLPRYQAALKEIRVNNPFAQVYVNWPALVSRLNTNSAQQLSPQVLTNLRMAQGLGSTITLESDGLKFQNISWLKPDAQQRFQGENNAKQLPSRLPGNTLAMTSGSSFQTFWQEYTENAQSKLAFPFDPEQLRSSIRSATGMDFERDFVQWMNGEFALALIPGQSSRGGGLVLMAQTSDRQAAERAFTQLDRVMANRYNLNVGQSKIEAQSLTTWQVPPGLPVASHGWLEDNTVFFTLGTPVEQTFLPQPQSPLAKTDRFTEVTRSSLQPANGYFFVDMPQTLAFLESSPLLPKLPPNQLQFAQAIETIGVTAAVNNEWSTRHNIQVKLKKVGS